MQCRKNTTAEDNKKRMNIANFINIYIYTQIYMPILYVTRMTQNKKRVITQKKLKNSKNSKKKLNTTAWSCCWQ